METEIKSKLIRLEENYNKNWETIDFNKWIPEDQLKINSIYLCKGRGFTIGIWNGESFYCIRNKFKFQYVDTQLHWDDGPPHGTVKPFKEIFDE